MKGKGDSEPRPRGHAFQRPSLRKERGRDHAPCKATPLEESSRHAPPSATTPSAPGSWGSPGERGVWESQESESVSLSALSDSQRPHGLTLARQAPLSMGCSRPEYWSGKSFPSPRDLPDQESGPPALADGFFTNITTWEAPV